MKRLHVLALLGLAMAHTNPMDFARLCSSGDCPTDWKNISGTCGKPNRGSQIAGGIKKYPWQVRLSQHTKPEHIICGGSVLTRHHILTTSSCTQRHPAEKITVWSGDYDIKKMDGEVSHAVCSKTEHPDFDKNTQYDQDIAILHLCQPLVFNEGRFSKYSIYL